MFDKFTMNKWDYFPYSRDIQFKLCHTFLRDTVYTNSSWTFKIQKAIFYDNCRSNHRRVHTTTEYNEMAFYVMIGNLKITSGCISTEIIWYGEARLYGAESWRNIENSIYIIDCQRNRDFEMMSNSLYQISEA